MNVALIALLLLSALGLAGGQLLLKAAMSSSEALPVARAKRRVCFSGAVALMTLSFFVGLGLLQRFDLSYVYPFQGLNVLVVTAGSALFLRERLSLRLCAAVLVIALGVALVFTS